VMFAVAISFSWRDKFSYDTKYVAGLVTDWSTVQSLCLLMIILMCFTTVYLFLLSRNVFTDVTECMSSPASR